MSAHDATVVVGVAASESFECESLGDDALTSSSWSNGHAIGYAATGAIIKNGVELGRVEPYHTGDTVGVLVNMNDRRIAFFLNGVEQHVSGIQSPWSHASTAGTRSCATQADAGCCKEQDGHDTLTGNDDGAKGNSESLLSFDMGEQKQEGTSPPPSAAYHITRFDCHAVFPALTYSVKTDECDLSMCYPTPKHASTIWKH